MRKVILALGLLIAVATLLASNPNTVAGLYTLPVLTNPTSETAVSTIASLSTRAVLVLPMSASQTSSVSYIIRARGRITTGASINSVPSIRFNSGANTNLTTFTGDTVLLTGSFLVNTTTIPFLIEMKLIWDASSGHMYCTYGANVGNNATAPGTLCSGIPITVTTQSQLQLFVTDSFSGSNAANAFNLDEFSADPY